MNFRSIKEVRNLKGKRVLVRVDFNVPIVHGKVANDTRIVAAVPTIKWLMKKGAKIIVGTHFGRPNDKIKNKKSKIKNELEPISLRLSGLLKKKVAMVEEWDFKKIGKAVKRLKASGVLMLPNLRLHPGEERNDAGFAKELAGLADIFVNEAFSVCHRAQASIVSVPALLPSYAGLRLEEEVRVLADLVRHPRRPLVVLIGGAKIVDKIGVIKNFVHRASAVLVGGASANHFFKAMGYGVGASPIESDGVRLAKALLKNKKIVLPKDVVVGTRDGKVAKVADVPDLSVRATAPEPRTRTSSVRGERRSVRGFTPRSNPGDRHGLRPRDDGSAVICKKPYAIFDIGPRTITHFSHWIRAAHTLIWNGPMGVYERKEFSYGTAALAQLFAARARGRAFGVIGGGETIDAVRQTGMMEYVDFVSVGGGAMLEFLSGKTLPGLEALYAR